MWQLKSVYFLCSLTIKLLLIGVVSGNNQPAPGSSIQQFLINYNFETYPATIRGSTPTATVIVGTYDLLYFNANLVNQTSPSLGTPCHTLPACAAFSASNALLNSILGTSGSVNIGPAYITSQYKYSPITYFIPYAFYYSCVVASQNGAASTPTSCDITASGTGTNGKEVYRQVFQFRPTAGQLIVPQKLGFFDAGWSGQKITTLYLTVSNNLTTAALFDNFVAQVFGPQNAAVLIDF